MPATSHKTGLSSKRPFPARALISRLCLPGTPPDPIENRWPDHGLTPPEPTPPGRCTSVRRAFSLPGVSTRSPKLDSLPESTATVHLIVIFLSLLLLGFGPRPGEGQSLPDLLRSIQQGGGWVRIPVEDGGGSLRTVALPTGRLALTGCLQVWGGHSGSWDIRARDLFSERELNLLVGPGEPRPFMYEADSQAQLQIDVRWSEPRDTTLLLWVGLDSQRVQRNPCVPVYGRR
jgi:hypothetical protein